MHRPLLLCALSISWVMTLSCEGCDTANTTELNALLSPDVTRIDFGDVFVGTTQTRTLRLSSLGTGAVLLDSAAVSAPFGTTLSLPYALNPSEVLEVEIIVSPTEEGRVEDVIEFVTDAENARRLEIELSVNGLPRPPCDDDNACTNDAFDEDAGTCTYTFRQGPCDDGNLCTQDDRCSNGNCVGDFLECSDGIDCTIDACSPDEGCLFVGNDDACSDEDGCTLDVCTEQGCEHSPAPDYTVCGEVESCVAAEICLSQVCVSIEIPDGAPCSDNDACTIDDLCSEGICVGEVSEDPPGIVETRLLSSLFEGNTLRRGNVFFNHSSRALEFDGVEFIPRMIQSLARATSIHELDGRYALVNGFEFEQGVASIVDFIDPLVPRAVAHSPISLFGGNETMVWGCSQNELIKMERTTPEALGQPTVLGSCNSRFQGRGAYAYEYDGDVTVVYEVGENSLITLGTLAGRVQYSSSEKIWLLKDADDNFSLLDISNFAVPPRTLPTGFLQALTSGRVLWRNTLTGTTTLYTHTPAGIEGPVTVSLESDLEALLPGYIDDAFLLITPRIDVADAERPRTFIRSAANAFVAAPLLGQISGTKDPGAPVLVSGDEILIPWMPSDSFTNSFPKPTHRMGANLTNQRPNVLSALAPNGSPPAGLWQFGQSRQSAFNFIDSSASLESVSVQDDLSFTNYYAPPANLRTIEMARGEGCGFFAAATRGAPGESEMERGIAHIDRCLDGNANLRSLSLLAFVPLETVWVTDVIDHENFVSIVDFVAPGAGRSEIHLLELTSPTTLELRSTLESHEGCNGSFVDEGVWLTHAAPGDFSVECELALRDLATGDILLSRPLPTQAKVLAFEFPIAVVAFSQRVEFVDVETLATVSSFDLPRAGFARFQDDIVYVHHEGGVSLISPPCGP